VWALGVLVLARIAIPLSPEGDWMSRLTECACRAHSFCRFESGSVKLYGHDGEPTDSPLPVGTYTKIGWNTYQWRTTSNKKGPVIIRPGWFFSKYEMPGTEGTIWAWRYPLFTKANWIVCESESRAATKALRKPKVESPNPKSELSLTISTPVNVLTQGIHRIEFSLSNKGTDSVQIFHWNPRNEPANVRVVLRSRRGEVVCRDSTLPRGVEEDETLTLQPGQTITVPAEVSISAWPGMYHLSGALVPQGSITTPAILTRVFPGEIVDVPSKK
jgi:hypothetical protein